MTDTDTDTDTHDDDYSPDDDAHFELNITLGNDAMTTEEDVADALRRVAAALVDERRLAGSIADTNGNTVGWWEFTG